MIPQIPFEVFAEGVRSEVVKASSDSALLERLIFPLIQQQRLWDHYPALLHGLWAAVWSSFYMTLCRLFEFRDDWRLASLANLLRRIELGERPEQATPARWEAAREAFLARVPARHDEIKSIDAQLAFTRSGYLAHRDLTKASDHAKAQIAFTEMKRLLSVAQQILSDYFLAFRDESHSYEPSNYHHEPAQFLRWCRLDDYATHHAAWVEAEYRARLNRFADPAAPPPPSTAANPRSSKAGDVG